MDFTFTFGLQRGHTCMLPCVHLLTGWALALGGEGPWAPGTGGHCCLEASQDTERRGMVIEGHATGLNCYKSECITVEN